MSTRARAALILACCNLLVIVAPATAFVQPQPGAVSLAQAPIQSSHLSVDRAVSVTPTTHKTTTNALFALKTKTDTDSALAIIGPSIFFLAFADMLTDLCRVIQNSTLPITIGTSSLYFVSAFVAYDNLIIGLGDILFPNAGTNEKQNAILRVLSYPRFVFHALGVPFLFVTVAEIGKAAGVEWLESDWIQNGILVAAVAVALVSRVDFFQSPGIELADTSDSPPHALERQLMWFTYKEPDFLYVLPSLPATGNNESCSRSFCISTRWRCSCCWSIADCIFDRSFGRECSKVLCGTLHRELCRGNHALVHVCRCSLRHVNHSDHQYW